MAVHTRNAIKKAFAELAAERPIEKITVRDLTVRSQVSRNTFYYYFHDVYGVLEEYLDDIVQEMVARIRGQLAQGETLEEAFHQVMEHQIEHKEQFYCIYQSAKKEEVLRCMGKAERTLITYFMDELCSDVPASRKDKELLSYFYVNGLRGLILQSLDGGLKWDLPEAFSRITFLMGGQAVRDALVRAVKYPKKQEKTT